jgi:hypothetical protein
LGPVVEHVALTLFERNSGRSDLGREPVWRRLPTPLTGVNRSLGRDARRKEPSI